MARIALDLFKEQFFRLVSGQAGDALQLVLLLRNELFVFLRRRLRLMFSSADGRFSRVEVAFKTFDRALPVEQLRLAPRQRLLESDLMLTFRPCLAFSFGQDLLGLFLRVDERLFAARLGVALRILREAKSVP